MIYNNYFKSSARDTTFLCTIKSLKKLFLTSVKSNNEKNDKLRQWSIWNKVYKKYNEILYSSFKVKQKYEL